MHKHDYTVTINGLRVVPAESVHLKLKSRNLSPEVFVLALLGEYPFSDDLAIKGFGFEDGEERHLAKNDWHFIQHKMRERSIAMQRWGFGRRKTIENLANVFLLFNDKFYVRLDDLNQWQEKTKNIDFKSLELNILHEEERLRKLKERDAACGGGFVGANQIIPILQSANKDTVSAFLLSEQTKIYTEIDGEVPSQVGTFIKRQLVQCIQNSDHQTESISYAGNPVGFGADRIYSQEFTDLLPAWAKLEPEPKEG